MGANILGFNGVVHSVVGDVPVDSEAGDVPVDSEASVVTSSISRICIAGSVFKDAHRGRVCVRVFIGCECACACAVSVCIVLCNLKRSEILS